MKRALGRSMLLPAMLFALAGAVRAAYVLHKWPDLVADNAAHTDEMESAAISFATSGTLGNIYYEGSGPSAHVAPGYPVLLGAAFAVFGTEDLTRLRVKIVFAVLATALAAATMPLVALQLQLKPLAGIAAGIFLAVSPRSLWWDVVGAWDNNVAALALLSLVSAFAFLRHDTCRPRLAAAGAGIALAFCALFSPVLVAAGGLIMVGEVAFARQRSQALGKMAIAAVTASVAVAPWTIRNYVLLGDFVPLRSTFGLELHLGNNWRSNGITFGDPILHEWHPLGSVTENDRLKEVGEITYMQEKGREARRWIGTNPGRFMLLTIRRIKEFWWPGPEMFSGSAPELRARITQVINGGAFCGLLLLLASNAYRWLIAAAFVAPSLPYAVTHVNERYFYPVSGLSALLASFALVSAVRLVPRPGIRRSNSKDRDTIK